MNAAERFISFCGVSSEAPRGAELLSVYTELGQALYHDHRKRAPGKNNEDVLARFLVSCLVEAGGSWCIQRFTKLGSVRLCLEDVFGFRDSVVRFVLWSYWATNFLDREPLWSQKPAGT